MESATQSHTQKMSAQYQATERSRYSRYVRNGVVSPNRRSCRLAPFSPRQPRRASATFLKEPGAVVMTLAHLARVILHLKKKCSCEDKMSRRAQKRNNVISLGNPACVDELAEASGHNVRDRVAPFHLSQLSPLASGEGKALAPLRVCFCKC